MIVNIRGTHGSGKSTIIRTILDTHRHEPTDVSPKGRPNNYVVTLSRNKKLYVVGSYVTACGGCDGIQPYDLIWPRVMKFAKLGSVIFEGALVSSSVGNIGRAMAARTDCIVGFMDTPLEICLQRIAARRAARGDTQPLNPTHTQSKFDGILRSRPQLVALGLRCVTIDHKKAVMQVLKLLKG